MKSYHISRSLGSPIRSHSKVVRATIYAVVLVTFLILRGRFHEGVWIFFALIYALLSYFFPIETPDYDLEVDGEGIRIVQGGEMKRLLPRERNKNVNDRKTANRS